MDYGYIPGVTKPIARLVQGTVMLDPNALETSFALLDGVFDLGCNAFDTAHIYGLGSSERVLGHWIRERGLHDEVVIITKGAHPNEDRRRVTPFDITADLHDSLARLQVDAIDLYLLHRDDPAQPFEPIIDVLNEHLEAGKINAFGGSNWSHDRLRAANQYAARSGQTGFAVSSPHFSLAEQVREPWEGCVSISGPTGAAARVWYRETNMPLFTWSSLAGGFFSGRFTRENLDTFDSYFDQLCIQSYGCEDNFRRLDRARQLAGQKGLNLPQIALAYVLSQPLTIFALVGCRTPAEFSQNRDALDLTLTPDEMNWLDLKTDKEPTS